jgi:4-amino-4-deoxy-L-arabinose transferase-like glycosyltransferase
MRFEKYVLWLIAAALGIKFVLFLHIAFVDPASIMQNDSYGYLADAKAWMQYFSMPSEGLRHSIYRTPGYSFFLAVFHLGFNLPLLGIIFLQIVFNILTAIVVFKTVPLAGRQAGLLSAAIVLLDIPTTIYSSMILTESLHVFVLSLCLYAFVKYINDRRLGWLVAAALFLVVSVYIRPVGYFLGITIAGFVLYLWGIKKVFTGMVHAMVVLILVYGFLGIWQYHNLKVHGVFTFSDINNATIVQNGIIGRYARETDPQLRAMPPVLYYVHSVGQNFLNLMTTPGNMRHFHSRVWRIFGVIFGYFFVIFWWVGLIAGMRKCKTDAVRQFLFLVLLYFILVSLVATGWHVTPRFRVPMMPALAILSAWGWTALLCGKTRQAYAASSN